MEVFQRVVSSVCILLSKDEVTNLIHFISESCTMAWSLLLIYLSTCLAGCLATLLHVGNM